MAYETLLYETAGEVGILTYNRPKIVNAINRKMLDELNDFWSERHADFQTRVVIVRGAGEKGFCSGVDLKAANTEFADAGGRPTPESIFNGQNLFSNIIRLMRTCPQPIIAAVHGPAMGAGMSFALASDVRLASEDAFFNAQYINIGVGGADMGSSYFLWRIVGWGRAAEMCLTGDRVPAAEAYRIGLVNHVYTREDLFPAAMAMATNMCSKSKLGLRLTKDAFNAALNASSVEDATRMEDRNQAFFLVSGLLEGAKQLGE
jgi:enoyl-CoA hydratase/carnithine racemase